MPEIESIISPAEVLRAHARAPVLGPTIRWLSLDPSRQSTVRSKVALISRISIDLFNNSGSRPEAIELKSFLKGPQKLFELSSVEKNV